MAAKDLVCHLSVADSSAGIEDWLQRKRERKETQKRKGKERKKILSSTITLILENNDF